MALPHQDRIDAGIGFDWNSLPSQQTTLADVSSDAEELCFRRERSSHRGLHRFKSLRRLWLYGVNQEFIDEIVQLPAIESLYIDGLTAADLSRLSQLPHLRRLILRRGAKIQSLEWVVGLPHLESFWIEDFRHVSRLDPLVSLSRLSALDIGGSTFRPMRVQSLAPLSRLHHLRYLFISCLRTEDSSLVPLHSLSHLEVLECGSAYFSDDEFRHLREALPKLRCQWFDMIDRYGSTKAGVRALVDEVT